MAISGHGISHGIHHTRCCTNRAQLAHAFNAQDVVGAGNRLIGKCMEHFRHDVCSGCRIVHQTAGQQLTAFCVINHAL